MKSSKMEGEADSGVSEVTASQENEKRPKVSYGTMLRPSTLERLRAASTWTGESMASIVGRAIEAELDRIEADRGEEFEILPHHEVEDS